MKKSHDYSLYIWGYLAPTHASWSAGQRGCKTEPCTHCGTRCLKLWGPLALTLKAWPLLQTTNCSPHTQFSLFMEIIASQKRVQISTHGFFWIASVARTHTINDRAPFTLLAHQDTGQHDDFFHSHSCVYCGFSHHGLDGGCYDDMWQGEGGPLLHAGFLTVLSY